MIAAESAGELPVVLPGRSPGAWFKVSSEVAGSIA
jgi:hypothetical protein